MVHKPNIFMYKSTLKITDLQGRILSSWLLSFAVLKPKNVKTVDKQTFGGCLCERCVNVELLRKSLNSLLPSTGKIRNRYHLSDITVCPYEHFPKLECVQRKCEVCGVNKGLKDVITLLQDQNSKDIHIALVLN